MAKYVYPAVISKMEDAEYGSYYHVIFPDIEGCFTDGDTMEEALENAADVLNFMMYGVEHDNKGLSARNRINKPTPINEIKKENAADVVTLVYADTVIYGEIIKRENNPIRYAREKAGLNIKQLAELLQAPYRTVQDWNAGKKFPPKWVEKLVIEKIETAY